MLWHSFPCKTRFFYLSFCLLLCASSLSLHLISIEKYKWPLDRTFRFHYVDLHCTVRIIHLYLQDVFMMSWEKFLILTSSFFSFCIFSGVCATLTVLKPTSILFVLPMGNLMIMHVKSKRHHARNRRKLKSCLWVDVKVTLITKLISKNVFNFCSGRKKKKNQGWVLIWQLLHCSSYCRARAVRRGRALHGADAERHEEGTTPNPALISASVTSLLPRAACPELCLPGSTWSRTAGMPLRYILPPRVETLWRCAPKLRAWAGSSSDLHWAPGCPRCLEGSFPIVAQGSLCFPINTMLLCAQLLSYYITCNPWAEFKNPVFL